VSDEFTVPLCRVHHREAHRCGDERAWWAKVGVDPLKIALNLWANTRSDRTEHEPEHQPLQIPNTKRAEPKLASPAQMPQMALTKPIKRLLQLRRGTAGEQTSRSCLSLLKFPSVPSAPAEGIWLGMTMQTTAYGLLLSHCGLSLTEGAHLSAVDRATVKAWYTGRRDPPRGSVTELRALDRHINAVAQRRLTQIQAELKRWAVRDRDTRLLVIADCKSAEISRTRGLPFPGAWHSAVGRALVKVPDDVRTEFEARNASAPAVTTQDLLSG